MITQFLLKLFLGSRTELKTPRDRMIVGMFGGGVGIFCNVVLFATKLCVGLIFGSIAIMADAVNNLADSASSFVTVLGLWLSGKPADDEHPFGHGRVEYVSALFVAILVVAVGLDFLKEGVIRIFKPENQGNLEMWMLYAVGATMLVKLWMFFFYRGVAAKIDSAALRAAAFDSLGDMLITAAVVVSMIFDPILPHFPLDGVVGTAIALFILVGGIKLLRETVNPLLGVCPDPELVNGVEKILLENPDICGVHDLRMHNYGPGRYFASAHAEVNADADPVKIHDSLEESERQVSLRFPVELLLHADPFSSDDPEYKRWRIATVGAARVMDDTFRIYDFRLRREGEALRLEFHLLIPRNYALPDEVIQGRLERRLREIDPHVFVDIIVDYAFV